MSAADVRKGEALVEIRMDLGETGATYEEALEKLREAFALYSVRPCSSIDITYNPKTGNFEARTTGNRWETM